jgi:hypothetical protein
MRHSGIPRQGIHFSLFVPIRLARILQVAYLGARQCGRPKSALFHSLAKFPNSAHGRVKFQLALWQQEKSLSCVFF